MVLNCPTLLNTFQASDTGGMGIGGSKTSKILTENDYIIWNDVGIGIVPIGAVTAWLKNLPGCPALLPSFVECNGQVLADAASPFNGQTIPDLNGTAAANHRMLKGQSASGGTGGAETYAVSLEVGNNADMIDATDGHYITNSGDSGFTNRVHSHSSAAGFLPSYYEVVWVMRIK